MEIVVIEIPLFIHASRDYYDFELSLVKLSTLFDSSSTQRNLVLQKWYNSQRFFMLLLLQNSLLDVRLFCFYQFSRKFKCKHRYLPFDRQNWSKYCQNRQNIKRRETQHLVTTQTRVTLCTEKRARQLAAQQKCTVFENLKKSHFLFFPKLSELKNIFTSKLLQA